MAPDLKHDPPRLPGDPTLRRVAIGVGGAGVAALVCYGLTKFWVESSSPRPSSPKSNGPGSKLGYNQASKPKPKTKPAACVWPKSEAGAAKVWATIEPTARLIVTRYAASRSVKAIVRGYSAWFPAAGNYWRWVFEQSLVTAFEAAAMNSACFYGAEKDPLSPLGSRLALLQDDVQTLIGSIP